MLEISVLVLILQIGFNAALNYRGYNQNPLIPSSRLLNYGQSRRVLSPNSYLSLPSRRIPASESFQSDSEDSSLEETNYRRLHPLQSLPYHGQNSLRYNTRTENDVSLEMAPIGRMSSDNYADVYPSSLSVTNEPDTNFRRPYLRNKPPNLRQAQSRKYHRRGENDLSLEESDRNNAYDYNVDNLVATHAEEDTSYLRSLLSLIELPNHRQNQNRKYHRKGDNDLSLEISPVGRSNPDQDSLNGLPRLRTNLDDASFLESLLTGLEQPNNRRANLRLEKSPFNKLTLADNNANSNSLRSSQSNPRSPNNRRKNRNGNKKAVNNVLFDMQSPDKDTPDAYIDTVFLVSGEGKPDDIAIARPQLRNTGKTYARNNDNYNRRNYDGLSPEVSSNDRLHPDDLSAFRGLNKPLRSRKLSNNSPNVNQQPNRRNNDNVDLESLLHERLSPDDDDSNNISFLSLVNLDDLNLEPPQLRSRDQNKKNNRRDNVDELNLALSLLPSEGLSPDDVDAANLANLRSDNLDELNFVPPSLRNNELSNQKNNRRENYDTRRELLNDRFSAEDDSLSNLSVLSLGSLDDLSIETPLLRSRDPSSFSLDTNLRTSERDNNREGLELLFNDRLSFDDSAPDSIYQDLTLRSRDSTKNHQINYNRQDNDDENLELLSNDRLYLDENAESDLSVLSLGPSRLRSRDPSNRSENTKNSRRDDDSLELDFPIVNRLNSNNDDVALSANLDDFSFKLPRLRSGNENKSNKQDTDVLHLEFPWNDQLNPDNKDTSNLSNLRGLRSQLKSQEKTEKQQDIDSKDYDLYLEFPWNDQPTPDVTKVPKLRSYNTEHLDKEQSYLRNRNRNRNNNRKSYNNLNLNVLPLSLNNNEDSLFASLENKEIDTKSFLRQSNGNVNNNQNLEFLSYSRQGLENDTSIFLNSDEEDPSSFISFPLDRRPYTRHRTQEEDRPLNFNRRSNTPLATATVSPNSTETLDTTEETNESGTYNDTIIFPTR